MLVLHLYNLREEFVQVHQGQLFVGARPFRFLGVNAYYLLAEASYGEVSMTL